MRLALACALACTGLAGAADARTHDTDTAAREAIVAAVRARMGTDADVRVVGLRVVPARAGGQGPFATAVEVGARLGRPVRFALRSRDGGFAGQATCTLHVFAPHLRTTRALRRGHVLVSGDVEQVRAEVGNGPVRALPLASDGVRVTRDLPAGAVIGSGAIAVPPLVRSGSRVTAVVRIGSMEARGHAVASQSGDRGEWIRVVNPESGRAFRGRVVARGEVEVAHAF